MEISPLDGLYILSLHHIGSLKSPLLIESDSLDQKDLDRQAWSYYYSGSVHGYALFAQARVSALRWTVRR